MSENTPAPWRLSHTHYEEDGRTVGYTNVIGPDGDDIGVTIYNTGSQNTRGAQRRSDAALIAAAPDLLEAAKLQEAADLAHLACDECDPEDAPETCGKCFGLYDDARIKRRLAIAKATGAA